MSTLLINHENNTSKTYKTKNNAISAIEKIGIADDAEIYYIVIKTESGRYMPIVTTSGKYAAVLANSNIFTLG